MPVGHKCSARGPALSAVCAGVHWPVATGRSLQARRSTCGQMGRPVCGATISVGRHAPDGADGMRARTSWAAAVQARHVVRAHCLGRESKQPLGQEGEPVQSCAPVHYAGHHVQLLLAASGARG